MSTLAWEDESRYSPLWIFLFCFFLILVWKLWWVLSLVRYFLQLFLYVFLVFTTV